VIDSTFILCNISLDIMYYDLEKKERFILQFKNQTAQQRPFSSLFSLQPQCDGNMEQNKIPIPSSHSSAFVDIDTDCQNDLVIHSEQNSVKFLEIWRGHVEKGEIRYCLSKKSVYILDSNLGQFTVADINRDGVLDIIFPVLKTANILIAYNKISLEFDWTLDYYRYSVNMQIYILGGKYLTLNYFSN